MDYKDMRIMLSQMLDKTINCWFYACQSVLGITDGGLACDIETSIDKCLNNLCDICIEALKYQHDCAKRSSEAEEKPKYTVDSFGNCTFMLDKHIFSVGKVDNIHEDKEYHGERTTDVAILYCYYDDGKEDTSLFHLVPNGYIYGATDTEEFKDGATVHELLIKAAKEFIKNT